MSTPTAVELLATRLARFKRLRELNAPDELVETERRKLLDAWIGHMAEHGVPPELPELGAVGRELGLTCAPAPWWKGDLTRIGPGPSALSPSDSAALTQLAAGFEVTDFAGLFSGEGMFLAGKLPGATILRPPPTVTAEMPIFVISKRLCTFDPFDATHFEATIQELDRRVPGGYAKVYLAHWDDEPAAILILLGSARVTSWAPARPDAENNPMPVPPILPMSAVRFGVGIADREELAESMDVPRLKAQLASLAGTPVAGSPKLVRAIQTKTPLSVLQLRDNLKVGLWHSVVSDVLGVAADAQITSYWGLSDDGNVAALAVDFGRLRLYSTREGRPSMPALQLSPRRLGARLRVGDPTLSREESERRGGLLAGRLGALRELGETRKLVHALAVLPGYERFSNELLAAEGFAGV